MPKRARSDMTGEDKRRIAIAIAARERSQFPYSTYGTAHYMRGTDANLARFGPTYKTATVEQQLNRKATGFVGRGRYTLKDAEAMGDRFLKKGIPNILSAATNIRKFLGRGKYSEAAQNDLFSSNDSDDIVISHTEFLQSIVPTATSGFQTQFQCVVNPGLATFAPMLSQIAKYYDEYEMIQLVFEFKSTVTDGNNNAEGTVLMASQYNPTAALFTSDIAMDNYAHSVSSKVTNTVQCGVECARNRTGQATTEYVRSGPVPSGQDPKTYDLCTFQIATQDAHKDLQIGRLYVHYKVRLSKLKLLDTVVPTPIYGNQILPQPQALWSMFFTKGATMGFLSNPLGDGSGGTVVASHSTLGPAASSAVGRVITFATLPSGTLNTYKITLSWYLVSTGVQWQLSAAASFWTGFSGVNCSLLNGTEADALAFPAGTLAPIGPANANVVSTRATVSFYVQVVGGVASPTLTIPQNLWAVHTANANDELEVQILQVDPLIQRESIA